MDYPIENLDPERFQQLCQALLIKEQPNVQCFPVAQPDGGRDALSYYPEAEAGKFSIFQVKFVRKPWAENDPHKWLLATMEGEAPKVRELIPKGATRYCLMTNISGTAHPGTGSIDKLNNILTESLGIPSVCWWRDDINRRLDDAWDVKWVYPELMTGPDFLRAIVETGLSEERERRSSTLRAFLRHQYSLDEEVRFKQVELQNRLLDLFIDVPIAPGPQGLGPKDAGIFFNVGRQLLKGMESQVRLDFGDDSTTTEYWHGAPGEARGTLGAASLLLSAAGQRSLPHVVVEGAPGQGKSTITQYVCQVHRMRLLQEGDGLKEIPSEHSNVPIRLPIKIDLRDYATWLNKKNPFTADEGEDIPIGWQKSLEAFIAALISNQSGGAQFSVDDVIAIIRISSILIVFDGLDEVADITKRQEVVVEIERGMQRLQENAASLQTIVTSRPAAFANSPGMSQRRHRYFQLLSLSRDLIKQYAERWLRARHLDGKLSGEFRRVLNAKLDQPHLRDLARNPMQLAILLSLIHTRGASLPDKRTALYDYYIDLFFGRESEKSAIVRDHRDLLVEVHRYLAWVLHSEVEQGNTQASITQDRLLRIVSEYLSREGHNVSIANELFTGMVERVVALVSRVEGTFEFEVQPLREYFAACYLYYTAPQSSPGREKPGSKPDRFDAIAKNFYWLNVTRFYAGCYSKGELPSLVERLEVLANETGFATIGYPRTLAATLLSDWVFTQNPRSIAQVVSLVLNHDSLPFLIAPLASKFRRPISGRSLILPPRCGRDEVVSKAFELLHEKPANDMTIGIVELLRANGSNVELASPWLEWFNKQDDSSLKLDWLRHGLQLGVLPIIELTKLQELIPEPVPSVEVLDLLLRGRRLDYLNKSESLFEAVVNGILDRNISGRSQGRIESPLDALSQAVDPFRYSIAFRHRQPIPLKGLTDRFGGTEELKSASTLLNSSKQFPSASKCFELAATADEISLTTSSEWASEIRPWDMVVEHGRKLWGDRLAFTFLANIAAGIRSSTDKCTEYSDFLDHSKSLCRRVRFARLRPTSGNWWAEQLTSAKSREDRLLILLTGLAWAKSPALIDSMDNFEMALNELSSKEWQMLCDAVRSITRQVGLRAAEIRIEIEELPGALSERTACALALRSGSQDSAKLYRKYLSDNTSSDPIRLEFAYSNAFDLERIGSDEWRPNLEAIKDCYKRGAREPKGERHFANFEPSKISLEIARKITSQANSFPLVLVRLAEERCRQAISANISKVADVAMTERWF